MTEVSENSGSSYPKVRDLIFAYERNTSISEPPERFERRQRSKSIGNALSYKQFRQPNLEIHNIVDIEKELVKIEAHLNYYEVYQKETHVAFQEQLFNILTSIVSIDPEGRDSTVQKKKDLIEETQKLAKVLNNKLPRGSNNSHKNVKRSYSHLVRKEEAVVSSTSLRTHENKAVFSSSNSSLLNNDFKSEESLNFTDVCSRQEDSVLTDLSQVEEKPESTTSTPPSESERSYIPSVARLKKFFSFRRDNKESEIKVIPAAYSGVTRTQSLNLKTNKYAVFKKENQEQSTNSTYSEIDEDNIQNCINNRPLITSSPLLNENNVENEAHNVEISLYNEPIKEIEEYREESDEMKPNLSVSKLKNMFEEKRKEINEGSYMNFTGLLRSVEIQKKIELNKSKSLSDLKSHSLRYTFKDIDVDDLSKELDDDDDFKNVVEKGTEEVNNNQVVGTGSESSNRPAKSSSTIDALKNTFDNTSREKNIEKNVDTLKHSIEQNSTEITSRQNNIHKTINSIPSFEVFEGKAAPHVTTGTVETLKSTFEPTNIAENQNNGIKYDERTTIWPTSSNSGVTPEVPPVLGANYSTDNGIEEHVFEAKKAYVTGAVENLKQTFEQITTEDDNKEKLVRVVCKAVEPVESPSNSNKSSVQYKIDSFTNNNRGENPASEIVEEKEHVITGTVEALKQTFEHVHTEIVEQNNELLSCSTRASGKNLEEPPVHSKIEFSTSMAAQEHAIEQEAHLTGTVEALKQTFERFNTESTNENTDASSPNTSPDKLLLEVPKQFRIEKPVATEHVGTEKNGHVNHVVHSTIQTVLPLEIPSAETILNVPTEHRTEFSSISSSEEQFEDNQTLNSNSLPVAEILCNESNSTAEQTILSETDSGRGQIANKTHHLMEILESPTYLTALVSSSSYSEGLQVSSSSNVSVSYSQKTSVQRTSSTHVSHQIVSSSSSSAQSTEQLLSSNNYLQVQQETNPRNPVITNDEDEGDTVTITEIIEDSKEENKSKKGLISLNISQENILDEILDDSKELENVDEEFEKILTEKYLEEN